MDRNSSDRPTDSDPSSAGEFANFDESAEPELGAIRALAKSRGISMTAARRLFGLSPQPSRPTRPTRSRSFLLVDTLSPFWYDGWYWLKSGGNTALRLDADLTGTIRLREQTFDLDLQVEPVPLAALPKDLQALVRKRRAAASGR